MKFFIPRFEGKPKDAEKILEATRKVCSEQVGFPLSERRIFKMEFTHDGKNFVVEVGQVLRDRVNETVVAILDAGNLYLVCTRNRGVVRGEPYLVGKSSAWDVVDFEATPFAKPPIP